MVFRVLLHRLQKRILNLESQLLLFLHLDILFLQVFLHFVLLPFLCSIFEEFRQYQRKLPAAL